MNPPQAFVNPPLKATCIIGTRVVDRNTRGVGTIQDVVVDPRTGEVAYAVLSIDAGPRFVPANALFAIAYEEFQYDLENNEFVLDVPLDRLEAAQRFDPERWPPTVGGSGPGAVYKFGGHSRLGPS